MRWIWLGLLSLGWAASAAPAGCGDQVEPLSPVMAWTSAGGSPVATCSDDVQNGDETDVDCGGPVCPACADGKKCVLSRDCASSVCTDGICDSRGW